MLIMTSYASVRSAVDSIKQGRSTIFQNRSIMRLLHLVKRTLSQAKPSVKRSSGGH